MRRTWTLRTERPEAGFEPRTSLLCLGTVLTTKLPVNNQRADWSPETAAAHVALQQHSPYTERACKRVRDWGSEREEQRERQCLSGPWQTHKFNYNIWTFDELCHFVLFVCWFYLSLSSYDLIMWLRALSFDLKNIFQSFKTCLWLLVVFLLSCWLQLSCREVSVVQRCIASSFSSPGHKSNYFLLYVVEEMQSA